MIETLLVLRPQAAPIRRECYSIATAKVVIAMKDMGSKIDGHVSRLAGKIYHDYRKPLARWLLLAALRPDRS